MHHPKSCYGFCMHQCCSSNLFVPLICFFSTFFVQCLHQVPNLAHPTCSAAAAACAARAQVLLRAVHSACLARAVEEALHIVCLVVLCEMPPTPLMTLSHMNLI